jgi:hypothetical protein
MTKRKIIIWIGEISIWLFFALEIITDFWFGSEFPGYSWKAQSISYLGQSGSPLESRVLTWGIFFTILITLFAIAFYLFYSQKKWVITATFLLMIYGLGEGVGSGCFPVNPPGTEITTDAKLHNVFSGIGDAGIVLFPFVLMLMFSGKENLKLHIYLWTVVVIGTIMASFFLIAKYFHPDNFILSYKGVWQRIYIFNYYIMFLVISLKMIREINRNEISI